MILVTAAAGRTGRHVIAALAARGLPVRAFVRRERPDLLETGANELFVGEMLRRDDLRRACEGVSTVIHTGPISPDETVMGRWAIDAAKDAGVDHFVYNSVAHPQTEWLLNHQNKLKVEDHLINSGLPFTILQPMHYFQNIDVRGAVAHGVYSSAYSPTVGLSFVDMADLAAAAAKVAAEPGHHYATYEICGSDHLTSAEVAALLTAGSGKQVRNEQIALDQFVRRIPGTEGYVGDFLIRLMTYYGRYGIRGNPNVLTWLLGRPPTTMSQYVERQLAS
jgi:uncharacterized protein YbjT (DUF2867 family)